MQAHFPRQNFTPPLIRASVINILRYLYQGNPSAGDEIFLEYPLLFRRTDSSSSSDSSNWCVVTILLINALTDSVSFMLPAHETSEKHKAHVMLFNQNSRWWFCAFRLAPLACFMSLALSKFSMGMNGH